MLIRIEEGCEYIRIDKQDTYNLYNTLSQIIAPMIRQLHSKNRSASSMLNGPYHGQLSFPFIDEEEEFNIAKDIYEKRLQKMFEMFEYLAYEEDVLYDNQSHDQTLELFCKSFKTLWE
jgi:hypothetical protein